MKKIQKKYRELASEDLVRIICQVADGQKALDVVAMDVRGLSSFADYFVVMGGTSTRHVQGLADVIDREIASKRSKPADTEGLGEGQWILLDFDDVIVHVFYHENRAHFDLEGLWHDAPRLDLTVPAPVVEEPAVKKARKKPGRQLAAKVAAESAGQVAAKPAKAARKTTPRVAKAPVKGGAAKPGKKTAGPTAGRSAAKPARKAPAKSTGKATGKPAARPSGRTAGAGARKTTAPRRRSTGGSKK